MWYYLTPFLLVGMTYKGSMHKQEGEFAVKYSDHKDICGVKMAGKWSVTFAGKPWLTEESLEATCGPVDDKLFEQPEQVADGTFVEKTTQPMAMVCLKHKGSYEKLGDSTKKLMTLMEKQKMKPMGPMMMTYLKAPPKVKKPKKFVTEICMPVAGKPPKRPKKKGKLVLKGMKPMNVLAVYGSGDYQKKSPTLMEALVEEAKKRDLKPSGPIVGVFHWEPGKPTIGEMISELYFPIIGESDKYKRP
jgi:effector-binding domain-containing protein